MADCVIDCSSAEYQRTHKILCKCGKPFTLYYNHQYWCKHCGEHAELITLLETLIVRQNLLEERIEKRTENKILISILQNLDTIIESVSHKLKQIQNRLGRLLSSKKKIEIMATKYDQKIELIAESLKEIHRALQKGGKKSRQMKALKR